MSVMRQNLLGLTGEGRTVFTFGRAAERLRLLGSSWCPEGAQGIDHLERKIERQRHRVARPSQFQRTEERLELGIRFRLELGEGHEPFGDVPQAVRRLLVARLPPYDAANVTVYLHAGTEPRQRRKMLCECRRELGLGSENVEPPGRPRRAELDVLDVAHHVL